MVKFGVMISLAPFEQMAKHSMLAEKLGFDSLWVPDHIVLTNPKKICLEAWCVLSALAKYTVKATLGSSVADPYRKHPAVLAQTVATLDRISGGRAILGLGAGEAMNVDPYGIPRDRRITRLKETIEIIRELWKGEMVNYMGDIYKLSNAFVQVPPIQRPCPPIYLAANSPMTRRLVGVYADGWLAEMMSPERYRADLKEVADASRKAGRDVKDIDVTCVVTTAVSDNRDEARKTALSQAKRRFLWWPKQLQLYGYPITKEFDWNHLIVRGDTAEMIEEHVHDVPDQPCEGVTIFGTPEDCIGKIDDYIGSGVTHFVFEIVSQYEETCELLGRKVMPYFEGRRDGM
jgi:phthiodiolone/phenolphthiodiolone dimycocerosates ketoreductase